MYHVFFFHSKGGHTMLQRHLCVRLLPIVLVFVGAAWGGVDFPDPVGGWTYVYTGDDDTAGPSGNFDSLDGTWDHDNGSDAWDGTAIGQGSPGGAIALTEGDVAFLRLQDTGDPRDFAMPDPSNRKIFFGHSVTNDIGDVADTWLDDGLTFSFRARVAKTPPLDEVHPDGGGATRPWPADGDGYVTHDGGKGNFGVRQPDGDMLISFALALDSDDDEISSDGLVMPKLNGTSPTSDVDLQDDDDGEINILEVADMTVWHEFWIVIQADASGTGTHAVTIYVDGELTPHEFIVTAGGGNDYDDAYVAMEVGATPQSGAIDIDFFAYKEGIVLPRGALENAYSPSPANGATEVPDTTSLSWLPGDNAATHDLYFGERFEDVNTGAAFIDNRSTTTYTPAELELGTTYYWRVDEQNNDGTVSRGAVWSFTVADFIWVDGFESYTDDIDAGEAIFQTWVDGVENGTGAYVGYELAGNGTFGETTIVHGGKQSMPLSYDNALAPHISEGQAETANLLSGPDWTRKDVKALSLWYRGNPPSFGSFVEAPTGTFTVTGGGTGVGGDADEFHFASREATGGVTVIARVTELTATDPAAMAGVMVRDSLDPDAPTAAVVVTAASGVMYLLRNNSGADMTTVAQEATLTVPVWVRVDVTSGGLTRAFHSSDGSNWTQIGGAQVIGVIGTRYAGLAVASADPGAAATAKFTNVTFPNSSVAPNWAHQDIGISNNAAEPMYVVLTDGNGASGVVVNDDPNAATTIEWTRWSMALQEFADQGVNLAGIQRVDLGIGDKGNPQLGGSGQVFFDDIRLYRSACVPNMIEPIEADLNDDCRVDFLDLEIMIADWLEGDFTRTGQLMVHYELDEGSGAVAGDSSGNSRDGTISGATWTTPGADGTGAALLFNGVAGEVNEPGAAAYLNGLDALTVSLWVKSNVTGTDSGVIIFTDPDGTDQRDIRYDLAGGSGGGTNVIKYGVTCTGGNQENESSGNVQTTEWQHLATTWKSGEVVRLYINGSLDTPSFLDVAEEGVTTGYTKILVGRGGKDADAAWDGRVDDVRVYDWQLSAEDIVTIRNGGHPTPPEIYSPITSPAELFDAEPINTRAVNFNDCAILAGQWLEERLWP